MSSLDGDISTNPYRSPRGRRSETRRVNAASSLWSSSSTTYTHREGDYRSNFQDLNKFSFGSPSVDAGERSMIDVEYEAENMQGQVQGESGEGGADRGSTERTPRSSVVIDNNFQGIPFTDTGLAVNQSQRSHQSQHTQIQFESADHHHGIDYVAHSIHSTFSQSSVMIPTIQPCSLHYTSPSPNTSPILLDVPNEGSVNSLAPSALASALHPTTCSVPSAGDITTLSPPTSLSSHSPRVPPLSHHFDTRSEHMPFDTNQRTWGQESLGEGEGSNSDFADSENYNEDQTHSYLAHDSYGSYEPEEDDNANSALHCYVGSETQSFVSSDEVDASSFFPEPTIYRPYASGSESYQSPSKRSSGSSGGGSGGKGSGGVSSRNSSSGSGSRNSDGYSYRDSRAYPGYNDGKRFEFSYEYEYEHGGEREREREREESEGEGDADAEDDVDSDMHIEISSAKFDSDSVVEGPAVDERWGMTEPGGLIPDRGFKRGSRSGWSMSSGRSGKSGKSLAGSMGSGSTGSGYGELRNSNLTSVVENGYRFGGIDGGGNGETTSLQRRESQEEDEGETKSADQDWRKLLGPVRLSPSPPSSPVLPYFSTSPDETDPPSPPSIRIHSSPSSDPAADFDMKYITQGIGFSEDVDEQKWDFVNPSKTSPTLSSYAFPIPSPGPARSHSNDNSFFEALESGRLNSATGLRTGDRLGALTQKRELSGEESGAQGLGKGKGRRRSIYFDLPGVQGLNTGEESKDNVNGKEKDVGTLSGDRSGDEDIPKELGSTSASSHSRPTVTVSPLNTSMTTPNNNSSTPTILLSYTASQAHPHPHPHLLTNPNLSADIHSQPHLPPSTSLSPIPDSIPLSSTGPHPHPQHPPNSFNPYVRRLSGISLQSSASAQSTTSTSMRSSNSFAHDDSFAKSLMVWGGKEYGVMRREWVVRKEKGTGRKRLGSENMKTPTQIKRRRSLGGSPSSSRDRGSDALEDHDAAFKGTRGGMEGLQDGDRENSKSVPSTPADIPLPPPTLVPSTSVGSSSSKQPSKAKEDVWRGMKLWEEETWSNFLLGRFVVTREEVGGSSSREGGGERSPSSGKELKSARDGKGKVNEEVGEMKGKEKSGKNERGPRGGQGKPPQQRLVIRRLRDSSAPSATAASGLSSVLECPTTTPSPSSVTSPSNLDDEINETATPKAAPSRSRSFSFASITTTARLHDPNHPPVIVHKHSKAIAFSLRRQHRQSSSTSTGAIAGGGKGTTNSASLGASNASTLKASSSTKKHVGSAGAATSNSMPSDSRSHVIMLAQRSVQETFENTEAQRKMVLDKHQAIMAAFAPGMSKAAKAGGKDEEQEGEREMMKARKSSVDRSTRPQGRGSEDKVASSKTLKEREENQKRRLVALGKKKASSSKLGDHGRVHATSEGQIETRNGAAVDLDWVLGGFRTTKPVDVSSKSSRGVGTRSAPVQISDRVGSGDEAVTEGSEVARDDEVTQSSRSHTRSPVLHEEHKSTVGTSESIPDRQQRSRRRLPSFSSQAHVPEPTSSKSSILKRLLPWDTSSSSSSSSRLSSSVGVVSTGSTTTAVTTNTSASTKTFLSVTSTSTTPTTTVSSETGASYAPPQASIPSQDPRKMQRKLIDSLEHSFEDVGLVPVRDRPKTKRKASFTGTDNSMYTKGKEGKGSVNGKSGVSKNDVLSCVPPDSLFMLLPLWPGDTDPQSQKSFPFEGPYLPPEDRKLLLVFYKALSPNLDKPAPSQAVLDKLNILIPGFHVIARQVTYSELQGTGVRVPDEGLAISGPLEEAYQHLPRSPPSTVQAENDTLAVRDCVIGSCYSREAGLEFDPQALVELGLCMELNRENRLLPPGTVVEQFDSEQQMTVKLTPIGNAVMEMVWIGGLALTSFGPG